MGDKAETVDFVVKQITQYIHQLNTDYQNADTELFPLETLLTSDYFNYLNNYSNGVLQFSKPSFLNQQDLTEEKFLTLFSLLIDKINNVEPPQKDNYKDIFQNTINEKLIKRIDQQIHTNININADFLPGMYFQYEMDCIGRNGALIGAKSILFNKSPNALDKDISHYIALISILSSEYKIDLKHNNFYLIAEEPSVSTPEHKTYEDILKNPLFKVIHSEESGEVADKVEASKARKFLQQTA